MSYQCDICGSLVGWVDGSHSSEHRAICFSGPLNSIREQDVGGGCGP